MTVEDECLPVTSLSTGLNGRKNSKERVKYAEMSQLQFNSWGKTGFALITPVSVPINLLHYSADDVECSELKDMI
ncbi:hypothetical protein TNCV_4046851 [Trichonephila clavipes]|nr:hypothetical protein TNCV_4046851 [Trichonephila clavipes]